MALLSAAVLGWAVAASAWAQMSQVPLTSRSSPPPAPNVMVTIDDSGSMLSDALPEGSFTLNGGSVILLGNWVAGFPADPRKGNSYQRGTVTAIKGAGATVYQMQFRSSQVNSIWYDPAITYLPWVSTDGLTRMANANPAAARWDPVVSTATFNLTDTTKSYSSGTNPSVTWYTSAYGTNTGSKPFNPGLYYVLTPGADPTLTASYTEYDVNQAGSTFPKAATRTDCLTLTSNCSQAEELKNFANWFTYYRMRESFTKGAVSETLANFVDRIRAGWGQINPSNAIYNPGSVVQQGIMPMDKLYLSSLLTNLQQYTSYPSTPTRTALDAVGKYFMDTTANNPWLTTPGVAGSGVLSCRRSVNVLMTDGYYNDSYSSAGNVDNVNGPDYKNANPNNKSPTQYLAKAPYSDTYSNTLADVVMQYYVTDLQPGIDNKVPTSANDIAYWQHLTQYTVGLGVNGKLLTSSTPANKAATLAAIAAGTKAWPDPSAGNAEKIDDLWHAAVNTGGDFYSVRNPKELATALATAFTAATSPPVSEGGVAVSANTLITGSLKLVPWFNTPSWTGELDAYALGANGQFSATPSWSASAGVPAAASRKLYTWDSTAGASGTPVVEFKDTNTKLVTQLGANLINYIRGDTSLEGTDQPYRWRNGATLGDFVDSPPVYVKDLVDLNYDSLDSGYRSFVNQKKSRANAAIFLGGNAGILHAFNGADGKELFGYLPSPGLKNLNIVAAKNYGTAANFHQFFVDGPLIETDALIATRRVPGVAWSNLVLGSMGAGGTGIFALHVDTVDPTNPLDANTVLWEKSSADIGSLGYVVSPMTAGKLPGSGGWVALVGNGAYSTSGSASLLVLDLATGVVKQELVVDITGSNGLMGVTLLQNTNQEIVAAYAGDLKGNLWRFDFDASGSGTVGFGGKPLFTALGSGAGQPITAAPQWVRNPSGNGRVVVFGTGRLLNTTDASSTQQQSLYGVLDPTADGASSLGATSPFNGLADGRTLLSPRTAATTPMTNPATGVTTSYYAITGPAINWSTQRGWYMDLPFPLNGTGRQREVYPILILQGAYALFQTIVPPAIATDCDTVSGAGYNYLLEAATGLPISTPTFDTNRDGVINASDMQNVGGFSTAADGSDKVAKIQDCSGTGLCPDGKVLYSDINSISQESMAIPKQVSVVKDRIWRQIMNPPL